MILGSHNSLSYLKPKYWWFYPFRFMAKCQNLNIKEQYNLGVRVFDIRLNITNKGKIIISHGLMRFKITDSEFYSILKFLNTCSESDIIWVRIINEKNKNKNEFISFCDHLKQICPNIKFYGGINKKDWKELFNFGYGEPKVVDKYASWNNDYPSSGSGCILDDLYPLIYAKRNNQKWKKEFYNKDIYLIQDFIEL